MTIYSEFSRKKMVIFDSNVTMLVDQRVFVDDHESQYIHSGESRAKKTKVLQGQQKDAKVVGSWDENRYPSLWMCPRK